MNTKTTFKFADSVKRILALQDLEFDWNSYGAKSISHESIKDAIRFLAEYTNLHTMCPYVVPTSRCGVQLEWHVNGLNVEVVINPSDEIQFSIGDEDFLLFNNGSVLVSALKKLSE